MIGLTIFNSIFDNKAHRLMAFKSFMGFETLLHDLAKQPGYKPKRGEKAQGSPLITPAIFHKGTTRANKNVISWGGWAAIDVDQYPRGEFEKTVDTFRSHKFVCYSSASSTREHPKFRIVMPLSRHVPAAKIKHFWYALNREYSALADPQTKDLSRMYYVPAQYPGAYNFIFTHDAPVLDPYHLMSKHAYAENKPADLLSQLPEEIQNKMEAYRKSALQSGKKYEWTSYKDCPFVNQRLVQEYRMITSTGWYAKMYQIMTSIAVNAVRRGYPIEANQIGMIARELDSDTGGWYKGRPIELEAARAISFALKG